MKPLSFSFFIFFQKILRAISSRSTTWGKRKHGEQSSNTAGSVARITGLTHHFEKSRRAPSHPPMARMALAQLRLAAAAVQSHPLGGRAARPVLVRSTSLPRETGDTCSPLPAPKKIKIAPVQESPILPCGPCFIL